MSKKNEAKIVEIKRLKAQRDEIETSIKNLLAELADSADTVDDGDSTPHDPPPPNPPGGH